MFSRVSNRLNQSVDVFNHRDNGIHTRNDHREVGYEPLDLLQNCDSLVKKGGLFIVLGQAILCILLRTFTFLYHGHLFHIEYVVSHLAEGAGGEGGQSSYGGVGQEKHSRRINTHGGSH